MFSILSPASLSHKADAQKLAPNALVRTQTSDLNSFIHPINIYWECTMCRSIFCLLTPRWIKTFHTPPSGKEGHVSIEKRQTYISTKQTKNPGWKAFLPQLCPSRSQADVCGRVRAAALSASSHQPPQACPPHPPTALGQRCLVRACEWQAGTSLAWGFLRWLPCGHQPLPGLLLPRCSGAQSELCCINTCPWARTNLPHRPALLKPPPSPSHLCPGPRPRGPHREAVTFFSKENNSPGSQQKFWERFLEAFEGP